MSKKWCQYCRVNIDYNRDAIRKHEETRLHQQNKQKQVNHQRRLAKKQHKNTSTLVFQPRQEKTQEGDKPGQPPKVSEAQEKREKINRMKAEMMDQVKSKLQTFIAQKTHGKFGANIEYPEQPLLTTQKYYETKNDNSEESGDSQDEENSDNSDDFKMWRIQFCSETKKPCFINNITGAKLYEKPAGVILTEQEINEWQRLLKEQQQNPEGNEEVNIGEWKEVEVEEDYFVANAVKEESEGENKDNEDSDNSDIKQDMQELRNQLLESNTVGDKSRMMKRLVQTGKQQTLDMKAFKQRDEQEDQQDKEKDSDADLKKMRGFLPRKRVKGMTIIGGEQCQ